MTMDGQNTMETLGILAFPVGIVLFALVMALLERRAAPLLTPQQQTLYHIGVFGRWALIALCAAFLPFADGVGPGHPLYPLGNNPGDWVMAAIVVGMAFFACFGTGIVGLVHSVREPSLPERFWRSPRFRFVSASLVSVALGMLALAMIMVGMLQNVSGIK